MYAPKIGINRCSLFKFVKAVEFRAGNTKIVHHALIFEDTEGIAAATDAMTPGYGFESFGGFGGDDDDFGVLDQKQYPGYTPGQSAHRWQPNDRCAESWRPDRHNNPTRRKGRRRR